MKRTCLILMLMAILAACKKEVVQIKKANENQSKQFNVLTPRFANENRGSMNPPPPPPPPR